MVYKHPLTTAGEISVKRKYTGTQHTRTGLQTLLTTAGEISVKWKYTGTQHTHTGLQTPSDYCRWDISPNVMQAHAPFPRGSAFAQSYFLPFWSHYHNKLGEHNLRYSKLNMAGFFISILWSPRFISLLKKCFKVLSVRTWETCYRLYLIKIVWIFSAFFFFQARKRVREMRRKRKIDWAVTVIHKYYMGWQVRRQFRSQFKRVAGPKIAKFFVVILVRTKIHTVKLF